MKDAQTGWKFLKLDDGQPCNRKTKATVSIGHGRKNVLTFFFVTILSFFVLALFADEPPALKPLTSPPSSPPPSLQAASPPSSGSGSQPAPDIDPRERDFRSSDSPPPPPGSLPSPSPGTAEPVAAVAPEEEARTEPATSVPLPASPSDSSPAAPSPAAVVQETSKTETKPTASSDSEIPVPEDSPLSKAEKQALLNQRLELSKAKNPNDVFNFIRITTTARNYRAAALAMAFERTNYKTLEMKQDCLAKWNHIIDRLDMRNPRDFPDWEGVDRSDRVFRTADDEIVLDFVKDSNNCWQLGSYSIERTDQIYLDVLEDPPMHGDFVSRNVPPWMHRAVLGLSYFKWTLLALGFLSGLLVYWIVERGLYFLMKTYRHVVYKEVTEQSRTVWRQVALIVMAAVWFYTFSRVILDPKLYSAAFFAYLVFVTIMVLLILMKIVDLLAEVLRVRFVQRYNYSHENVENLIVPMFSRTLKTLLVFIAVATLAQTFGWPLAAVLSGMGIGGIAIAFAAKETVANLFGSVTVMIDRPFEIGDWIDTNGIQGTVLAVGMRSTRIATTDDSVITIPNNNLITAVINNLGKRRNRRFKTLLTVQYDTSIDRIDVFCEGIKELILKNAFTVKEGFAVCLYDLSASSIDILLNVVLICPSSDTEYRERAKLLRNILKLAEAMDIRFAYPTQTLYLDRDAAPPYKPLPEGDPAEVGRRFASDLLYPPQSMPEGEKSNPAL